MKKITITLVLALLLALFGTSCKEKINIFSLQDDKDFGAQFDHEILTNGQFNILKESQYKDAHNTIRNYLNTLLATDKVAHANDFTWTVRIIDEDVVNAFAVPGGYLYFYTGLIKTLDNEAEFVGVMAHEMAHVARRHSTAQLTKQYGLELLLSMLLGKNSNQWITIAADMASGLTSLAFSRADENEADKLAVNYTYLTDWDARGISYFFENMDSHPTSPVFLSTHPKDADRVKRVNEEFNNLLTTLGERPQELCTEDYKKFINSLP